MIEYIFKKNGIFTKDFYQDDNLSDCLERAMSEINSDNIYPEEIKKDGVLLYEHYELLKMKMKGK